MEIYGTIGPSCKDRKTLTEMFRVGMNGVRLNLSHASLEKSREWIVNIQRAAEAAKIIPQILIDLQGPELRVGRFQKEYVLKEGEEIYLGMQASEDIIPIPDELLPQMNIGQKVLLDDGKILIEIKENNGNVCLGMVHRGGVLKQAKSIALPGMEMESETLTKEDKKNIRMAKNYGVTGVMLPFVRGKKDLRNLRQELIKADVKDIRIFAKIENRKGVRALEEIIPNTDAVVIARGDLGNAMPLWKLPGVQKEISKRCREEKREFMVVTQMLASMEHAKVPTRAEVTDIYNAVLDGASSVMLTGETAVGEYPVEAMEYLVKTVREAEKVRTFAI